MGSKPLMTSMNRDELKSLRKFSDSELVCLIYFCLFILDVLAWNEAARDLCFAKRACYCSLKKQRKKFVRVIEFDMMRRMSS